MKYKKTLKRKTLAQERASIETVSNNIDEVLTAEEIISIAFQEHEKERIVVSWSGGRCSTAALHLALDKDPDVKVFWNNHGVHFPRTVKYVKRMSKEWDLNFYKGKPERTFWDVVEEHGFPKARRPEDPTRKDKVSRRKPKCCEILKEDPLHDFFEEYNIEANISGLRVSESRMRMMAMLKKGHQYYYHKGEGVYKYYPVSLWDTTEVTEFLENRDIPLNPIYEDTDRSGCWPCTSYLDWEESLRNTNYKLYELLMKKMGRGTQRLLKHYLNTRIDSCSDRG